MTNCQISRCPHAVFNSVHAVASCLQCTPSVITSNAISKVMTLPQIDIRARHYKMVVGVLTADRTPPTVVRMVDALVSDASSTDYKVLARVSRSASHNKGMIEQLNNLGVTTFVNNQTYPEMAKDKVRITFNDPLTRVLWRTEHGMLITCIKIYALYSTLFLLSLSAGLCLSFEKGFRD